MVITQPKIADLNPPPERHKAARSLAAAAMRYARSTASVEWSVVSGTSSPYSRV